MRRQWATVSCSRAVLRATAAAVITASASPGSPGWSSGKSRAPSAACCMRCASASSAASPSRTWASAARRLLGEALLDLGEAVGVEETAEQLAARLGVGTQKAREIALGQQDDLAELLAAHAEELGDLLADLLVRAAEILPGADGRVVLAQPALGLLQRGARAALLGALPGRLPGDLQPASRDGQFEGHARARARCGVVAAQGQALAAVACARDRAVEGVAHGVEDGRLARSRRSVQQEE